MPHSDASYGALAGAILLEEHYLDPGYADLYPAPSNAFVARAFDRHLEFIDRYSLGRVVLSHAPCLAQGLPDGVALCRGMNDALARRIMPHDRLGAFGLLPMVEPLAAAAELRHCVEELEFHGAILHGLTNGTFPDAARFDPVFATAEELGVPLYLHPGAPHPEVMKAYYADYAKDFPMFAYPAAGYTCEMMVAAIRIVLAGIPRRFPGLRIILGHMGEAIPFLMERIDESLARDTGGERFFRRDFLNTFRVTTSGAFSDAALACTIAELGVERIAFSVDEPFADIRTAAAWAGGISLAAEDRARIMHGNATDWLRIDPSRK